MSERYRTIVADPPWQQNMDRCPLPYPTMTLDEIAALPVRALSDNTESDAHLYLWTTDQFLRPAFDIAEAWGFRHAATLVWCKPRGGKGLGGIWPANTEYVLFCRRGQLRYRDDPAALEITRWLGDAFRDSGMSRRELASRAGCSEGQLVHWLARASTVGPLVPALPKFKNLRDALGLGAEMDQAVADYYAAREGRLKVIGDRPSAYADGRWFEWPVGRHSQKPEAFLDIVEQVSPGPYLEMFARRARFGWDYWGDQSLNTAQLGEAA